MTVTETTTLQILCDNPACPGNTLDPADRTGWLFISSEAYATGPVVMHVYCSRDCAGMDSDSLGPTFPPALTELRPSEVTQSGQVQVHAIGAYFTNTARLVLDGVELATAFVSSTELYCTIDASVGGHAPGSFPLLVRQNGIDTPPLTFTITPV